MVEEMLRTLAFVAVIVGAWSLVLRARVGKGRYFRAFRARNRRRARLQEQSGRDLSH